MKEEKLMPEEIILNELKKVPGNAESRNYGGTETKISGYKSSRKEWNTWSDLMSYHNLIESEDLSEEGDNPVGASTSALAFDQQNIMALGLLLIDKLDEIAKRTGSHCSECCNDD